MMTHALVFIFGVLVGIMVIAVSYLIGSFVDTEDEEEDDKRHRR